MDLHVIPPSYVQVMQRRWAVTFGEPPRPRQEHEGQLTINALRATAMLLATHGAVFCDPSPPEIFDKLHDAYQGLLSAMRTALLTPPETVASAFGAGSISQVQRLPCPGGNLCTMNTMNSPRGELQMYCASSHPRLLPTLLHTSTCVITQDFVLLTSQPFHFSVMSI